MLSSALLAAVMAMAVSAQEMASDSSALEMASGNTGGLDIAGYKRQDLGNSAINAPTDPNCYTYIGNVVYREGNAFNPARCVKDCEETTRFNAENLNGRAVCRFVNTYVLIKNGKREGQVCAMYSKTFDQKFATNNGYHDNGDEYTITSSYSYSNEKDPGNDQNGCIGGTPGNPQTTTKKPEPEPTSTKKPGEPTTTNKQEPTTTSKKPEETTTKKPEQPTTMVSTSKQPQPTAAPPKCFKAIGYGGKISGRYLEARGARAEFEHDSRQASTLFINKAGQLRDTSDGSFALVDYLGNNPWGYVEFEKVGKYPQLQDCKLAQKGDGEYLTCGESKGQEFRVRGANNLVWGSQHSKLNDPVQIKAEPVSCPAGASWFE